MRRLAFALLLLALTAPLAPATVRAATGQDEFLADPAKEERARGLTRQIRCVVCQNQSIDDSDADLARDLRRVVRERIAAGADDRAVLGFLTARYGDFVLLSPPVRPATYALWFGPAAVLALGTLGVGVFWRNRRRDARAEAPPRPLDAAEAARLRQLVGGGTPD